ncbi:DUF3558 family protein [Corynebacterium sp. HMSC05H05]|uniref:DUF3558 family protein n=1 Tax=Corynebacterium sp. HMSC05H05 TaxID=1581119 RepID=UPI000AE407C8|nr:DUF3558 family protein [Corynebacterium sp. HMSC05H05]
MKRHIVWLMACGVLAGCASEPSPIDAPPAPTANNQANEHSAESAGGAVGGSSGSSADSSADAPAAFHFKSGTLEIGDFDPFALGDDIFDPCTEISHEEFAAAGFHNVEPIPEEYRGLNPDVNACSFGTESQHYALSIAATNANREVVEQTKPIDSAIRSQTLPPIYVYGTGLPDDTDCFAQIDTARGGLSISVTRPPGLGTFEDSCEFAISTFESLFFATT